MRSSVPRVSHPAAGSSGDGRHPARGARIAVIIAIGTMASYGLAWLLGVPALVPVLNTLPAFPFLFTAWRGAHRGRAIGRMLVWAGTMAVCSTAFSGWRPAEAGPLFLHAEAYRQEMFAWVRTGIGAESDPMRFVPRQLTQAALFLGLSALTGSAASMPLGAALMNEMGFYAGTLARASAHPTATVLLAWHPWALVRVASFVTLGAVLAGPMLARVGRFACDLRDARGVLGLAIGGLLVDMVLKWLLAPSWQVLLKRVVGW